MASEPSSSTRVHFGRIPPNEVPLPNRQRKSSNVSSLRSSAWLVWRIRPSSWSGGVLRRPALTLRSCVTTMAHQLPSPNWQGGTRSAHSACRLRA